MTTAMSINGACFTWFILTAFAENGGCCWNSQVCVIDDVILSSVETYYNVFFLFKQRRAGSQKCWQGTKKKQLLI